MDTFRAYFCLIFVLSNMLSLAFCQSEATCLQGERAKKYNDRLVKDHNKYRSLHGTPPLEADAKLMEDATQWSKELANKGTFDHSNGEDGENLYRNYSMGPPNEAEIDPVKPWYDEIKLYTKPEFSDETGHFTQVVWKDSRKLGCGLCSIPEKDFTSVVVTCRYSPAGNFPGKFEVNVPPPNPIKPTTDTSAGNTTGTTSTKLTDTDETGTTEVATFKKTTGTKETTSTGTRDSTSTTPIKLTTDAEETTSVSEGTTTTETSEQTTDFEETTSVSEGTTTTETSEQTTDIKRTTPVDKRTTPAATPRPDKNSCMIEEILFIAALTVFILCLIPLGILLTFMYNQMISLRRFRN